MKNTATLILVLFSAIFVSYGQEIVIETTETLQSENLNILVSSEFVEPIPTPEEQGFTKYVENGIIIYRKELNGVITEFIPKQ